MRKQTYWRVLTTALFLAALPQMAQAANISVDAGGTCTLPEAITSANSDNAAGNGCVNGSGADTITLQTDVTLVAALPEITSTITIEGEGHVIDGNSGNFSVLSVGSSGNLTINESTVTGGNNPLSGKGGGLYNNGGTVSINNTAIKANKASSGGGVYNNGGTVSLTSSTVNNNYSGSGTGQGGGICTTGNLTLTNSTVSNNGAYQGAGLYSGGGSLMLVNSTVSDNGNIASSEQGMGIYNNGGTVTLRSSIVSGNRSEYYGVAVEVQNATGTVIADSFNVFGCNTINNTDAFISFTPGSSDVVATSDGGTPTALAAILSPLADNGGPTKTHALLAGSPAINLDTACNAGLTADQRGYSRPVNFKCDAGAVEYSPSFSLACGNGRDLPKDTWLMTAPSCQPAVPPGTSINAQYGNDIPGGVYGTNWIAYSWNTGNQDYVQETAAAPLTLGAGNWVYSTAATTLALDGAATPTTDCAAYGSSGQCFDIDLAIAPSGQNRWNMVGHPFPCTVNWADVKIAVSSDGGVTWTTYTPSAAETAGYASKTFHRWTGSAYEPQDDSGTPGMSGTLQPQEAVWVRSLGSYSGPTPQKLKLLIPAR